MVGPGHRYERRTSTDRRARGESIWRDRLRRKRDDLRNTRCDDGEGCRAEAKESLVGTFRSRSKKNPRRSLDVSEGEQGLPLLSGARLARRNGRQIAARIKERRGQNPSSRWTESCGVSR